MFHEHNEDGDKFDWIRVWFEMISCRWNLVFMDFTLKVQTIEALCVMIHWRIDADHMNIKVFQDGAWLICWLQITTKKWCSKLFSEFSKVKGNKYKVKACYMKLKICVPVHIKLKVVVVVAINIVNQCGSGLCNSVYPYGRDI